MYILCLSRKRETDVVFHCVGLGTGTDWRNSHRMCAPGFPLSASLTNRARQAFSPIPLFHWALKASVYALQWECLHFPLAPFERHLLKVLWSSLTYYLARELE